MRFHVLGVGAIGSLVAFHLRKKLRPASAWPISLVVRRRGIPRFQTVVDDQIATDRPMGSLQQQGDGGEDRVTISLRSAGPNGYGKNRLRSVSGFDYEVNGPAILKAIQEVHRTHQFKHSSTSEEKKKKSLKLLEGPHTPNIPIDSLLITLKCPQTVEAVSQLKHRLGPTSCITLLQNGMGVYDELCKQVWPEPEERPHFILGSTTHGATAITEDKKGYLLHRQVNHNGVGQIKFGIVPDPRGQFDFDRLTTHLQQGLRLRSPDVRNLLLQIPEARRSAFANVYQTAVAFNSLQDLNPSFETSESMSQTLLLKLAVNAAINPLTALLGIQNGKLLERGPAAKVMNKGIQESSRVLLAYLHTLDAAWENSAELGPSSQLLVHSRAKDSADSSTTKENFFHDFCQLLSPEQLENRVFEVLTTTAANTSSMLTDRLAGRITEIDYINGYIVQLGQRLGVPTPVNEALISMIKHQHKTLAAQMLRVTETPTSV